jgi:hypothetical protein
MSVKINVRGKNFDYPSENDSNWGPEATEWAQEVSLAINDLEQLNYTGLHTVGPTGPQGVTGVIGSEGPRGQQGVTGLASTGVQGATGLKGLDGIRGAQGVTGLIGSTGVLGPQGNTGIQGNTGFGIQGATGTQGIQGNTGIQGQTGPLGNTGVKGDKGIQGNTGIQGATGMAPDNQGTTGLRGPTGPQGADGFLGGTGPQGNTGIQGTTGVQGITGLIGATGMAPDNQGTTGIQGTTGVQGVKGDTGIQGVTGPLGQTGVDGIIGSTGVQGIQGDTGIQGNTGVQGDTGIQGTTGIQGIQGNTGIIGNTGIQGIQGDTGIQGQTGIQGNTGIIGNTGIQGQTGIQGTTGVQGIQGDTGIQGQTGIQGETGVQGIQGDTGIQGTTGAGIQGATGLEGPVGPQGAAGVTGLPGGGTGLNGPTGPQGETGVQGVQGTQGETGVQGIKGDQGVTGLAPDNQGTTGIQGVTGLVGTTGVQGITGLMGTTGLVGQTGIQGAQGETGLQGLGVTGAQGVTGTGGLQGPQGVTGPRGMTGIVGSQGTTGAGIQGVTGLTGPTGLQGRTGLVGQTGAQGATGAGIQGVTGLVGQTGAQGLTGETGAGIQGVTGLQGIQGATGAGGGGAAEITGLAGHLVVANGDGTAQGNTGLSYVSGILGVAGTIQGVTGLYTGNLSTTSKMTIPTSTGLNPAIISTGSYTGIGIYIDSLDTYKRIGYAINSGSTEWDYKAEFIETGNAYFYGNRKSTVEAPQISFVKAGTTDGTKNTEVWGTGAKLGAIDWRPAGVPYSCAEIKAYQSGATGMSAKIVMSTRDVTGTVADRLTILETGNVGIGVTGPSAKLDVAGTIQGTTGIFSGGVSASNVLVTGNRPIEVDSYNGNVYFTTPSSGGWSQGFGYKDYTGSTGMCGFGTLGNGATVSYQWIGEAWNNYSLRIDPETDLLYFGKYGDSTMKVDGTNKRVGINTTSPSVALDVNGTISGTTGMFNTLGISYGSADSRVKIGSSTASNAYLDFSADSTYTSNSLRIIRYGSGGANGNSRLEHRGTGEFSIRTNEVAPIGFYVNNTKVLECTANKTVNTTTCYQTAGVTGISGANISPYSFTVAGGIITGQTGTAATTPVKAYGGMTFSNFVSPQAIELASQGTYYGFTAFSSSLNDGTIVSFTDNGTADRLTLSAAGAGSYKINVSCSAYCNASANIEMAVFKNGTSTNLRSQFSIPSPSYFGTWSISDLLSLSNSDYLDIRFVNNTSAGKYIYVAYIGVTIERIS